MVTFLVALVGLLWGSFANVLIARVPQGENWITESSRCPGCRHAIAWYDNMPVLSWLILRGRCRHCGMRISPRYPIIEVTVSLAFVGVFAIWGLSLTFMAFAYLAFMSIVLVVIDLDVRRLPDALVLPSYAVGAVLLTAASIAQNDGWSLARAGIGIVAMGGFYGILWLVYPAGMGFGDVKTAGLLGMHAGFLGWANLCLAWFAGPMLGGLVVLVGLVFRKLSRKSAIPYGPALIVGAWIGFTAGEPVIRWYLHLMGG
jgi:leader peptidase (prepilin peptidase)/N-methyltransferase